MKALIRNKGETITETMSLDWIDWDTGAPLTNEAWCGGPYTLVEDYVPPKDDEPAQYVKVVKPEQIVIEENEDDYVVIDGKRYSKEELRSLL